jgi:ABC-2 type transport system permease protein
MQSNEHFFWMSNIKELLGITVPDDLDMLITGIIALVFAVIFARIRKTEWAGKSIALRPFRWIVKIVVCFIAGLGSGLVVYYIYNAVWNQKLFTMMCIIMLLATFVTGCIVEVILEGNIRRFFKGIAQTVMAMAFVLLTFVIMRGDLLGYDSYVPAKAKGKSCAIVDGVYDYNFYSYYMNYNDLADNNMEITDIDNFLTVARAGMVTRKAESRLEGEDRYDSLGYNMTILYRLNSGREVYRRITVPYNDVDDALAKIIDSDEYKTGHFPVFNDDSLREGDGTGNSHELRFSALGESKDTRNFDYSEFSDALRKDLLEHYSFEYAKNNHAVGSIEYHNDGNRYVGMDINIYDNYSHTLDLLKKYDIYIDPKLDMDNIKEIRVTNYYPGHDLEAESINDIDSNINSKDMIYTDKEQIAKILESSACGDYYNQWQDYEKVYNGQYNIEIFTNSGNRNSSPVYYTFYKGKVPDFVKEDTN